MLKIKLLPLFLLMLATACSSQKESAVELEITNNFIFGGPETSAFSGGGLMVWGQSSKGASFARAVEDKDSIQLNLINDNWTFFVMSWSGDFDYDGNPVAATDFVFGGKTRCAKAGPILLSGGKAVVNLNLANAACADIAFTGSVPADIRGIPLTTKLPKTRLRFCDSISDISGRDDLCTDDLSDLNRKARRAPVASYRVTLNNHFSPPGPEHIVKPGGLLGPCIPFDGLGPEGSGKTGTSKLDFPSLPGGGPNLPFHASIEVFLGDAACDLTTNRNGPEVLHLPNGVTSQSADNKYIPDTDKHIQYLKLSPNRICQGRKEISMGGNPFAGGTGTSKSPYIICSVPQWQAINTLNLALTPHIKLQDNLDFKPHANGIGPGVNTPFLNCLEQGNNFVPIGYVSVTCSGLNPIWADPVSFKGQFFGAGHKLSNLWFKEKDQKRIGLFAQMSGNGVLIQELELFEPVINGPCYVGGLVGSVLGQVNADSVALQGIRVTRGNIEAHSELNGGDCPVSSVGGIAGEMVKGKIINSFVTKSKIKGKNDNVGGAVGMGNTTKLFQVSVEAEVDAYTTIPNVEAIGGVVGYSYVGDFQYVKHEGQVVANGKKVGGIVGVMDTATSFKNFYAISSVINHNPEVVSYTGGVIGDWINNSASTALGFGYSMSLVKTGCPNGCEVGAFKGGNSGGIATPNPHDALYKLPTDAQNLGDSTPAVKSFFSETTRTFTNYLTAGGLPALATAGTDDWIHTTGSYPRFDFEKHPCSLGKGNTGDGTAANPFLICSDSQYASHTNANLGNNLRLISNIRLNNAFNTAFEITTLSAHLNGEGHALIGGRSSLAGNGAFGHIGTLTGSLKNIGFFGMTRIRSSGALVSNPAGILVHENMGVIENVRVTGFGNFPDYGGGIAGINNGKMRNVKFDGKLTGRMELAGLAYVNLGSIEDSEMSGEIFCNENAGCDYFSGLVAINSKNIFRVEMSGRVFDDQFSPSSNTSMVADNNGPDGIIEDVLISREAIFKVHGSDQAFFSRVNDGVINRSFNMGKLLYRNIDSASVMGAWPVANEIAGGGGTYADSFRAGRSGKLLLSNTPFTCTPATTDRLDIPGWSSLGSPITIPWVSAFGAAGGYVTRPLNQKKLIVEVRRANGSQETMQVLDVTFGPSNLFFVSNGLCTGPGTVDLYWTDDIPFKINPTTPNDGVVLIQDIYNKARYGLSTPPLMWKKGDAADDLARTSYLKYINGFSATPIPPAVWNLDKDGPRLLKNK